MADTPRRRVVGRPSISAALLVGVAVALLVGGTAHADPAGPTDYRSEVVAIEPPTPGVDARIIGGDSFFELTVAAGTEVYVIGYTDDDYYLWFRPDGVVFENQNSPTTYLNRNRYGGGGIPDGASVEAEPDWEEVATGGTWLWHDHRAHWMQSSRPVGFAVGDQILDESIPLQVDGADVAIRVTSTWLPAPSPVPAVVGALAGAALVAAAWVLRRRGVASVIAMIPATLLVLAVGAWQFWSLPSATGPRPVWVVLPAIAVVCAIGGSLLARRRAGFGADAASLVVGVELAVWGLLKRDGISAAIIPTDAPMWLDRLATTLALTGGVGLAASALWWLFAGTNGVASSGAGSDRVSGSREPTGSPLPGHP